MVIHDVESTVRNEEILLPKQRDIKSPAGIYECSVCGQNVMTQDIDVYMYCHGCGADMRGEEHETD